MPYVTSNGQFVESRSPWRLSIVTDFFYGCYNFITLFIQTLIPINISRSNQSERYTRDYRPPGGAGPPPPARRRYGGVAGANNSPSAPPCVGGG